MQLVSLRRALWAGLCLAAAGVVHAEPAPETLPGSTPSGLSAEVVAQRAAANSSSVAAALARVSAAQAGVMRAEHEYWPRLVTSARAAVVSRPPVPSGPTNISVVTAPAGSSGLIASDTALSATPVDLSFNPRQTQIVVQGALTVPISDYLTRIAPLARSARALNEAARRDLAAVAAESAAEARICYYEWLRTRAAVVISIQALSDSRRHAAQVRDHMTAGIATQADALQAESAALESELALQRAYSDMDIAEAVVRSAIRAAERELLVPSETLDPPPSAASEAPARLVQTALAARPELRSAAARAEALHAQSRAERAATYPALALTGNVYYANPPLRQVQQADVWAGAWDVGLQLNWSVNDLARASAAAGEREAEAKAVAAERSRLAQAIALETLRSERTLRERLASIALAERRLETATAGVRAARDLFESNEATPQVVLLSEQELTSAKRAHLGALADAWIVRVQLDRALGRSAAAQHR